MKKINLVFILFFLIGYKQNAQNIHKRTSNNQKLYNVTADPENPKELKFDKSILANNNIFKICEIKTKN